ncbi:hypothetical protein RHMOL_Rhmol02G0181000 [Rhododendron molle]|uniref:Uncharacterized protein n=1 Tax=Rhododendron molle TaxID=49168 RepID=A0ACC0PR79_RHOML|nr:hypothetical protein RHMOL_Rhmol02G0181000 [Rhododendron molle]
MGGLPKIGCVAMQFGMDEDIPTNLIRSRTYFEDLVVDREHASTNEGCNRCYCLRANKQYPICKHEILFDKQKEGSLATAISMPVPLPICGASLMTFSHRDDLERMPTWIPKDYIGHNDDTTVQYGVILSGENMTVAKQEGLLKKFKFTSTIIEKVQELCADGDKLRGEVDELSKATPKSLWIKDLDALDPELDITFQRLQNHKAEEVQIRPRVESQQEKQCFILRDEDDDDDDEEVLELKHRLAAYNLKSSPDHSEGSSLCLVSERSYSPCWSYDQWNSAAPLEKGYRAVIISKSELQRVSHDRSFEFRTSWVGA